MIFYVYTHRAQSYQNNPHKAPYGKTNTTPPHTKKQNNNPTMDSNVYDTDLYHTSYMRSLVRALLKVY